MIKDAVEKYGGRKPIMISEMWKCITELTVI